MIETKPDCQYYRENMNNKQLKTRYELFYEHPDIITDMEVALVVRDEIELMTGRKFGIREVAI